MANEVELSRASIAAIRKAVKQAVGEALDEHLATLSVSLDGIGAAAHTWI